MSFDSLWPQLSALHSNELPAGVVEWKVLYSTRPRPLLVPVACPDQARQAIDFFVSNRLLRWWGRLTLVLDRALPSLRILPRARLERFPIDALFGENAVSETRLSIHCGSPGPLRKLTIFYPTSSRDGTGEICKVAAQPSADESITKEAHWLRTLGKVPSIAAFMPQLLRDGTLPCERRFLTMSALAYGELSSRFGEPHVRVLELLAERESSLTRWSSTEPFKRLSNRVASIADLLDRSHAGLFADVLGQIDKEIGKRELPVCLVHGDFAPWNLRVSGDRLLVFDWEYAEAGGNPLQDYLHFHLAAPAVSDRAISPWYMRRLLSRAAEHAERVFGENRGFGSAAGALTLHYLLDTVAFYIDASRCLDPNDPVVRAYVRILEQRERWLPEPVTVKEAKLGWQ